jgi:hypothetical protein
VTGTSGAVVVRCGILLFAKIMQLADRVPTSARWRRSRDDRREKCRRRLLAFVIEAMCAATTSIERGPG